VASVLQTDNPVIKLSEGDSTTISARSLQELRSSGKVLEIELPNGLVIRIDSADITENAASLNIYIDVRIAATATVVNTVQFPANSIIISPSAHGEFGLTKSFDISAEMLAEAGLNGNNVRLFHISTAGVVTEHERIRRNSDGSITISISHASRYVLAEDTPITTAVADDTPVNEAIPDSALPEVIPPAEPIAPAQPTLPSITSDTAGNNAILWIVIGLAAIAICSGAIIIIRRRKHKA
jgi:hypothetical protein